MFQRLHHRVSVVLLALLLLDVTAVGADIQRELYDMADRAGQSGRIPDASRLFCELDRKYPGYKDARQQCAMWTANLAAQEGRIADAARAFCKLDKDFPGFKDARQQCSIWTAELKDLVERSEQHYVRGVELFQQYKYDDSEAEFRKVRAGGHVNETSEYLQKQIPEARQFESWYVEGVQLFQENQMEQAEQKFRSVLAGRYKEEADKYVQERIPGWYFEKGVLAFEQGRYETAETAFQRVHIGTHATQAREYLQKTLPHVRIFKQAEQAYLSNDFERAKSLFAEVSTAKAIEYLEKIERYEKAMAHGHEYAAKKDCSKALASYSEAVNLKADGPDDPKARQKGMLACMERPPLPQTVRPATVALTDTKQLELILSEGIQAYRARRYTEAEVHFRDYLNANGKNGSQSGLCHFYLGASKLSRYYLGTSADRLLQDAKSEFCLAQHTPGFKMPNISPKIISFYEQSRRECGR